jgi:hypothetical protein
MQATPVAFGPRQRAPGAHPWPLDEIERARTPWSLRSVGHLFFSFFFLFLFISTK